MPSPRESFLAFRRSAGPAPRLERRTVRARGLDLAVFSSPPVAGEAPLLCINGGLLFGHEILWPALAPLALRRQLVLFDQRGRGASQAPPGVRGARLEHDAGDVPALREALGLERWNILGHSWGGGIAMLAAAQDGAHTGKLVLVDAVGATHAWMEGLVTAALARLEAKERVALARFDAPTLAAADVRTQSDYSRALYPAWFADRDLARMFAHPRSSSRTGAAVASRLRRDGYDWRAAVRGLRVPTLVIHAEAHLLPVRVAEETVALIPGARLVVIPSAGHTPFWEAPHEFFPLVDSFLGDVPHARDDSGNP